MLTDREWEDTMGLLVRGAAPSDLSRILGFDPRTSPQGLIALIDEATASRSADRIECAMLLAYRVGLTRDAVPSLLELLSLSCHGEHEGIVHTLQQLRDPRAVDALFTASRAEHAYLEYDELWGLARKCTWALADIGTPEALEKLRLLAADENPLIAGYAQKRIDNWEQERDRKG